MREGDRYETETNIKLNEALNNNNLVVVPKDKIRDIAKYKKYQNNHGQAISLKKLTEDFLSRKI